MQILDSNNKPILEDIKQDELKIPWKPKKEYKQRKKVYEKDIYVEIQKNVWMNTRTGGVKWNL